MKKEKIIIFKNDATGDLIHSREAIYNISKSNLDKEIVLFLSIQSKNFDFLFDFENITFKNLNKKLSFFNRIYLFYYIFTNNIEEIFILTPKNFFFVLPIFFRKIRFYAICLNDINNYRRPNIFFRKFIYKFIINDRSAIYKRPSIENLQNQLIGEYFKHKYSLNFRYTQNIKLIPKNNYFYFHLKQKKFDKYKWGIKELDILLNEFLKYEKKVIITRDIESNQRSLNLEDKYNLYDFNNQKFIDNKSNILLLENIGGIHLYNIIRNANKIIAFHGMITSFAWIEKKNVMDLYDVDIKDFNDYRKYRNSFYEFKPSYNGYNFIIPKKNIMKTIDKMKFFLRK